MNLFICPDSTANLLLLFDTTIAPPLLYYAYIPILIASIFFGLYILIKGNYSLLAKLLFSISIVFTLWIILILFQWTAVHANLVHFSWQILAIPETLIYILSAYFMFAYLAKKDIANWQKFVLIATFLPIIIFLPTKYNIATFDLVNCEGVVSALWSYVYILEVGFLVMIAYFSLKRVFTKKSERVQILPLMLGMVAFLGLFFLSNFAGELTKIYEINLVGPLGMVAFLALLSYIIVRFKLFNIRIVGAQALVLALGAFVFALLFIRQIENIRIVVSATLVLILLLGIALVKSVKKEVRQREEIEKLAGELKKSNDSLEQANVRLKELDQLKSEFISLATHQIRAPLTAIKGYASLILEGDMGKTSKSTKDAVVTILESSNNLVSIVSDFLDVSRIEQGKMKYDFSQFNVGALVQEIVTEYKPNIDRAGLKITFEQDQGIDFTVTADKGKIKQIIGNIVDNSIKYTPKGSIAVSVTKPDHIVRIKVSDTGVGIPREELPKLFNKFVRAKDAVKTNVTGTGLGLYIAKQMIEAHKGRLWAESEGLGKGSTFFVELPITHVD